MSRVLVTGGTGFIGSRIVDALVGRGDAVTVPTRDASRAGSAASNGGITFVQWEPSSPDVPSWFEGFDSVIHLAGEPAVGQRWTESKKQAIKQSRVESTEKLVAAMRAATKKPAVFICASGVGYYGAHDGEPLDETAAPGSDFLAGVTQAWESAARQAENLGVRVVRTRLGVVFGRDGGALAEMAKPFRLFVGGPIASGKQIVSWIHLDDLVAAFLRILDDPTIAGAVNVTTPSAVTNEELSAIIGTVLSRPSIFRVPEAALRLRFGEGADPLVTGQRALPRVLERAGFEWRYPEARSAVAEALG